MRHRVFVPTPPGVMFTSKRHPRTLEEAFGPYAGRSICEPQEPVRPLEVALRVVGVIILAACLLAAV